MSINSEISKKQDLQKYINDIIKELVNSGKLYKGNIKEEKLDGIYENVSINFKKIGEEKSNE